MAEQAKLAVEWVKVDSIHIDPANVRRHPERNLETIKASLARFGQQKPIVVDADGIVRAGNGTLEAARALNWGNVAIVRTPLKGSEATAYAIADNRSSELAEWDETGLAEQLRALQSEDFDLDAVGYSGDEVDALIERLAGEIVDDPAGEWQGMPEFVQEAIHEVQLIVYFASLDDKQAFSSQVGQCVNPETKFVWFPKSDKPVRQSAQTMTVENE
jgi:ParB-like chromosome segregation protein Spo0J